MTDRVMIDVSQSEFVTGINWGLSRRNLDGQPLRALQIVTRYPGEEEEIKRTFMVVPAAYQMLKESIAEHDELHPDLVEEPPDASPVEKEQATTT